MSARLKLKLATATATATALALPALALAAPSYTIAPLPSPGAQDVYVKGMNNAGQIVGYTVDDNGSHAALWDAAGIHYLDGVSSAFSNSQANAINNNGEIVGLSQFDSQYNHATYWSAGAHAVTDIGTIANKGGSFANDINDHGVVVGSGTAEHGQHAFTYTVSGGIVDWGSFNSNVNAEIAGFNAINNSGLMGGTHYYFTDPYKAMVADYNGKDQTLTNLSPLGARFTQGMVFDINDAGVIVGYQNHGSGDGNAAVFHPEDTTFTDLGNLGMSASRAFAINNEGVIVGQAYGDDDQTGFVYVGDAMYDLRDVISNLEGWDVIFEATVVNDNGTIAGEGYYNGEIRAFVLTPAAVVPEPTTAALLLPAAALLTRRRR